MKKIFNRISELAAEGVLLRALVYKFLVKLGIGRFFTFSTWGLRLRMFASDMTFEAYKKPEKYRTEDKVFLDQVVKPGGFVVDVGANIGVLTIQAAKMVGKGGRVISIEPNPQVVHFCRENVKLNGLENVTVFQTALGAKEGVTYFNCDPCDDRSRVIEKGGQGGVEVPISRLDKILEAEPNREIDLLKVDVEGYEFVVLEGAVKALERTRLIYIEVDPANYAHYGRRAEEMLELLNSHGFDTFVSDDSGKWTEIKGGIKGASANVIGKKRAERATASAPVSVAVAHS